MFHDQRAAQPHKPLVSYAKNSLQPSEKDIHIEEREVIDEDEYDFESEKRTVLAFPRFNLRRLFLLVLFLFCVWVLSVQRSKMLEEARLRDSVTDGPEGVYTAHVQPGFADMVLVQTLDPSYVPTSGKRKERNGRLVIVGDVHGMKNELVKLLEKIQFEKGVDHLVLAGDMISKGPDSKGVLDLIMELGATAVRGNHEDRILLAHAGLHSSHVQMDVDPISEDSTARDEKLANKEAFTRKGEYRDRLLAKQLSKRQVEWLKKCPVILKVGDIEGMGQVLVVHAGLVPGVSIHAQDPYFVMNMRTIDLKTHVPSDSREGTEWTKVLFVYYNVIN